MLITLKSRCKPGEPFSGPTSHAPEHPFIDWVDQCCIIDSKIICPEVIQDQKAYSDQGSANEADNDLVMPGDVSRVSAHD